MRAQWWWIDRWRKSSAYMSMTLEEQGAYRNLLDEIVLRDGAIPDDERYLSRASGDPVAWPKIREKVMRWMVRVDGGWSNATALEVLDGSRKRAERQRRYREKRNEDRNAPHNARRNTDRNAGHSPSPSPSPSPLSVSVSREQTRPANALVSGRRPEMERELQDLARRIGDREGLDPTEVMAQCSEWKGRSYVNAAAMPDDRLVHTLLAARRRVGGRDEGERGPTEAELEPYLERAASEVPDWSEADRRQLALEQWRGERRHEAWVRGGGRL